MTTAHATILDKITAYLEAHPEGVSHLQAVADLGLAKSTTYNNLCRLPQLKRKRLTRYFATLEALEAAKPAIYAEWEQLAELEKEKARIRRTRPKRAAASSPSPSKPKSGLTPSRHVSVKGPGGTSQAPDMSRAKVTVWPTPPSRYAVAPGEFVGMFSALGPGRYLNTEVLKG